MFQKESIFMKLLSLSKTTFYFRKMFMTILKLFFSGIQWGYPDNDQYQERGILLK